MNSLESSNRDALSLLDSKTTAYDSLVTDLNAQHKKIVDLRRQVQELEQAIQSANTTTSNAKFHEQGLQQEIEQSKRSNDWLDKELKAKSNEYTRYRKEKSLRINELQRENEDATGEIESLKKSETALRRRLENVEEKADNAFQRIQQLEEASARKEESFKIELDAAARLQDLTKKSAETEHRRQQDLVAELDTLKADMSHKTGMLAAEADTEHHERQAAESRVAELEVQVEHLQAEISASNNSQSEPRTPQPGVNGFLAHTPDRGSLSQVFSPTSQRLKGGISMTQLYSNYSDVSRKLDAEKRRNEELVSTIDNMIQEMELHGPEIEETRMEKNRLDSEIAEMSSLVETLTQERDSALKAARRWEGQVKARSTEGDVLRQQLRDLSSQIKILLMEAHLRSEGLDEVRPEERARLEQIANGDNEEVQDDRESETAKFINRNLVTFRTISELQGQNANLLKLIRETGEKMERDEAAKKPRERELEDVQQKYERCKEEIKSLVTQSQSYIKERDMFRRMLAHRGQIPRGAESMFDESIVEDDDQAGSRQGEVRKSIENGSSGQDHADYAKLLREFQMHFDSYKQEADTDKKTLREQLDGISKENSSLRNQAAKSDSQVTLAHERYEMLQANYAMLRTENTELQRRSQTYSENAAKQDLRVQQVAEDLVEAKGLIDSLRNETANIKAEKEFWKTIEKRINEDNAHLLNERNRLNTLNASLQNVLNEREHSEGELRRRLHSQIESLERDLQTTKNKLTEETEENKRTAQRREYEAEKSQKKIDDLITSLGSIREELVEARTSRDHLSVRVEELTIQLRSAEERAAALQPTPKAVPSSENVEPQPDAATADEPPLSNEQMLSIQVSELRRDLDLSKTELTNSKAQIEQYRTISQASEDELASLNHTQDLYREETDRTIVQKESVVKELEQRIEDVLAELTSNNNELGQLRNEQAEYNRRSEEQKKAFEAELAKVKDDDERHAAAAKFYQEDLKAQADIAKQAQQNYEDELVKHADAAKALQKVRTDYNEVKLEVVETKTTLETVRASLSQSEESWVDSRDRFEREISELNSARASLKSQNDHLHQQLENFSRRAQQPIGPSTEQLSSESAEPGLDNLQEVIKYLRREKEIADVQLELATQETKRLRQQLDYTQAQLDETRLRLNQQRHLEANSERVALDHNKLMETINDLNTLRESNVTLRAECRQAQSNLTARIQELEDLRGQMEPLEGQIRDLNATCEAHEGEAKLLKEDRDRWQQRAQSVLQKYDRIDPAELEALKERVNTAETSRDEIQAAKEALQEEVDKAATQIAQAQEQSNERIEASRARLTDQFKARSRELSDRIKERDAALQNATTERQQLEARLESFSEVQRQLEIAKAERDAAVQRVESTKGAESSAHDKTMSSSDAPEVQEIQRKLEETEKKAQADSAESSKLRDELEATKSRIVELEEQLVKLSRLCWEAKTDMLQASSARNVQALNTELAQLRSAQQEALALSSNANEDIVAKLQKDLQQAQLDAQNLRAAASVSNAIADAQQSDGEKSVSEQVAEAVEKVKHELESQHQERIKQTDEILEKRTKQMKEGLTKKLTEGKIQMRQTFQEENEKELQALKEQHEQEISKLNAQHKTEMDELRRLEEEKFANLKTASHPASTSQVVNGEPPAKMESESSKPEAWQPSEQEIRSLVQSSEVLRGILKNNVIKQVNKAKEDLTNQLNAEHEKNINQRINDVQTKADAAKEHAVALETKKTSLQINMQTNKAKLAQVKLDFVQKAAQETPQKPVSEVWAVAKDTKLPPTGAAQTPQMQKPPTPTAATFGRPTPLAQPSGSNPAQAPPANASANQNIPSGATTFGRPTPLTQTVQPNQGSTITSAQPREGNAVVPQQTGQFQAQLQPKPNNPQPASTGQANAGGNPATARGPQSGLPVARGGGTSRGNPAARGNARGRGSGISRGGAQAVDTTRGQAAGQGRGSPTTGMNPGAKQFVPGNKRPREENQDGSGGDGKRIKGAGAGGAEGSSAS